MKNRGAHNFIENLQNYCLGYAQKFLQEKGKKSGIDFVNNLEIHSIFIIGGIAKNWSKINNIDALIEECKDIDVDIYFCPKVGCDKSIIKKRRMLNTQQQVTKIKNYYKGKPLDIVRIVLFKPKSKYLIEDIKEYAFKNKNSKRWSAEKGRNGKEIIMIYPKII